MKIGCHNEFNAAMVEKYGILTEESTHRQVGGQHYLNKIQPWDIIDSWCLNFYEGNCLKYLLRKKNNRIEDLKKLIHYAEKLIELESGN